MIRRAVLHIVLCILGLFLFGSCQTYRTFYGETSTLETVTADSYRLDLSHQNLTEIPDVLQNLERLRMLNLSGNPDLDIEAALAALPHPEKLEVLLLDSLRLNKMPSLNRFVGLKQLSLSYNTAFEASDIFAQAEVLPLEFLNLKGNKFTALPEGITKMKYLKDLNLSGNHITEMQSYEYLAQLPELFALWLDDNDLEEWPQGLSTLSQVKYVFLNHNRIKEIPKSAALMENLWVLHMGHNQLEELPETLMEMPGLLAVHLNNNAIVSFPRTYADKSYTLMGLLLDDNPIPEEERLWAQQTFKHFFLLSFEQFYD